jgi:hypothetical protein
MAPASSPPTPEQVKAISSITDRVLRNLQITEGYYRLSTAMGRRTAPWTNWCTFAQWASRQAGCSIRGEDLQDVLRENTLAGFALAHPIQSTWRWLLRKGMLNPRTLFGRIVQEVHSPFDAIERTSEAVARGNVKVFEEIGRHCAEYLEACPPGGTVDSPEFHRFLTTLEPGPPPDGQGCLIRAFTCYQQQQHDADPHLRAQRVLLGTLEIGFHEQTRLQPEITASLEGPPETLEDLGKRALHALYPGAWNWKAFVRRPFAAALAPLARSFARFNRELARLAATRSLMRLALPGGITLQLGRHLDRPPAAMLDRITLPELRQLIERFEPPGVPDDCGARDWSNFEQRMHFILHVFRTFQDYQPMFDEPFTPEQARTIAAGTVPSGSL